MLKILLFASYFIIFSSPCFAQKDKGNFFKRLFSKDYTSISFKQINNNIVIPVNINNSDTLWFLLDTGLRTSIITELTPNDSISLNYANKIKLQGLGEGDGLDAITSHNNIIEISNIKFFNQDINVLMHDIFRLSNKAGTKINGIIGYNVFKNYIIEINYSNSHLKFYKPKNFKFKKNRKTVCLPLEIINNKPYFWTYIVDKKDKRQKVKLLIDTGSSLSLWLKEDANIVCPEKYVSNILGQGLNGDIYGKVSRIKNIEFGHYSLKNPIANFPDTTSIHKVLQQDKRNGSIGGDVLKRFNIIIDYTNKKICFKKNKNYRNVFTYKNSGIEIETPIPEIKVYSISHLMKHSPARECGLRIGDQITHINGLNTINITLNVFNKKLNSIKKKVINLRIIRHGKIIKFKMKTRKLI